MSRPSEPAIEITGLRKTYSSHRGTFRRTKVQTVALDGIDLAIQPGELYGLLGPNGAGKTTTVKILTTLLLPDSGTARVLGLDVVKQTDAVRRRIGFVFGGERGLYWRLSGLDNLRYFADLYRIPPDVSRRRIAELIERLGLSGRDRDKVEIYSRGMKQRLHLARGLLNDPEVLFLDEPTISLDPVGAREDAIQLLRAPGSPAASGTSRARRSALPASSERPPRAHALRRCFLSRPRSVPRSLSASKPFAPSQRCAGDT
jgi:ABC-2 type transport system ATP-binding protein